MGCWGMALTQSDEFCEIYDKFIEEYDNGKAVSAITDGILAGYHAEFEDDDGVMHDVYFALAKAEWMCGEQSAEILARVKEIIESGANIEFYRELEATAKDLKARQKHLEKFWASLQTPREKPRKRKRTAPATEKTFPSLEVGDCFAYKYESGFRVICILERFKPETQKEQVTVVIFNRVYTANELKNTDFAKEQMGSLFIVTATDFLGASVIKQVGHVPIAPHKRARLLGVSSFLFGDKQSFRKELDEPLGICLQEFLRHCEENDSSAFAGLEVGGCYAYPCQDGYRFAVILDHFSLSEEDFLSSTMLTNQVMISDNSNSDTGEYWLVAILSATSPYGQIDFVNAPISLVTLYDRDSLPNLRAWSKVGTTDVPLYMQLKLYGERRLIMSGILDFLQDHSALHRHRWAFHTLAPLLNVCKGNTEDAFDRLEVGDCYACKLETGYKQFIVLDRFTQGDEHYALVGVYGKTYPTQWVDYLYDYVPHIALYSANTLPCLDAWELMVKLDLPAGMTEYLERKCHILTEPDLQKFLCNRAYYEYTAGVTVKQILNGYEVYLQAQNH